MFSKIYPPLLNTPNPKATTKQELSELYNSPYLGAMTTRTSMLEGFTHNDSEHKYTLFEPLSCQHNPNPQLASYRSSLNTLGYSPITLPTYLQFLQEIQQSSQNKYKLVIVSVAGSATEVVECYKLIAKLREATAMNLAMEINLSCPNIPGKLPPSYAKAELLTYLEKLSAPFSQFSVPVGLKLPPYTYHQQFVDLVSALASLKAAENPIAFLTSTNTIGNSLLLDPESLNPVLEPVALGGLAGASLHPLALGNVYTLRKLLNEHNLQKIALIGVGGVADLAGYLRMRSAGADMVGIATGMLMKGLAVFKEITQGLQKG